MKVGVLGGGQLGRMLALAGIPLGFRFRFFDSTPGAPAGAAGQLVVAPWDDAAALERCAEGLDLVTYEFENVPLDAVDILAGRLPVHPSRRALGTAQDRIAEKECFARLGIPTAPYAPVEDVSQLAGALARTGLPSILKSRRMGYDGRGQAIIRDAAAAERAWEAVGKVPAVLEGFVAFERELSILSVRSRDGDIAHYPMVENQHRDGILHLSVAPAPDLPDELRRRAESYACSVLEELGYVGLLAIELFQRGDELIANEMAPRVHNSGHWTIEGAVTSQFENHLRAVAGLPLGSTEPLGHSAMLNLIGGAPHPASVLGIEGAHLHLYGKADRPRRKIGHVTVNAASPESARDRLARLVRLVG